MQLSRSCASCKYSLPDIQETLHCCFMPPPSQPPVKDTDWCGKWDTIDVSDRKRKEAHQQMINAQRQAAEEAERAKAEAAEEAKRAKAEAARKAKKKKADKEKQDGDTSTNDDSTTDGDSASDNGKK